MITVKRNGNMHYRGICPECDAVFEFDKTDMIDGEIWCPQCGTGSETEMTAKLYKENEAQRYERLRHVLFADTMNAYPKIKNEESNVEQNEEGEHKKVWEKLRMKKSK